MVNCRVGRNRNISGAKFELQLGNKYLLWYGADAVTGVFLQERVSRNCLRLCCVTVHSGYQYASYRVEESIERP